MPRKTLFYIIITIVVSATAAALVWYFIFGPKASLTQPAGTTLPAELQGKVKRLSSTPTLWAAIERAKNKILWYDQSGQLWLSFSDGSGAKAATQAPVQNFIKSAWSQDGSKNIISLGTSQKDIRFVSIFSESAVSNFLPNNTKSAAFSPDGKRIIYQVVDAGKNLNALFGSDPDGKKANTVAALKLRDAIVGWPQTSLISFVSKPSGLVGGSLWVMNLKTLVFDKLIDSLNGLEVLWSPDGNKILFSNTNSDGKNPRLAVMDLKGSVKDLNVSTMARKCSWASDGRNIYCAVPRNWPQNAVLPDDYLKDIILTVDDILKVNTETGRQETVISSIGDGKNLAVSAAQDFLILLSKTNQQLYRVNLK